MCGHHEVSENRSWFWRFIGSLCAMTLHYMWTVVCAPHTLSKWLFVVQCIWQTTNFNAKDSYQAMPIKPRCQATFSLGWTSICTLLCRASTGHRGCDQETVSLCQAPPGIEPLTSGSAVSGVNHLTTWLPIVKTDFIQLIKIFFQSYLAVIRDWQQNYHFELGLPAYASGAQLGPYIMQQ